MRIGLTVRLAIVLVPTLVLAVAGCGSTTPTADPGQVIHVRNDSNRAVIVSSGSMLMSSGSLLNNSPATAARPCGGEVTLAVKPADYETDGRLLAFLAVDSNGMFDAALKGYEGDPLDMPGDFLGSPIWSDGTLAGRLPLYLTVAPDLTVTESGAPTSQPSITCVPAY